MNTNRAGRGTREIRNTVRVAFGVGLLLATGPASAQTDDSFLFAVQILTGAQNVAKLPPDDPGFLANPILNRLPTLGSKAQTLCIDVNGAGTSSCPAQQVEGALPYHVFGFWSVAPSSPAERQRRIAKLRGLKPLQTTEQATELAAFITSGPGMSAMATDIGGNLNILGGVLKIERVETAPVPKAAMATRVFATLRHGPCPIQFTVDLKEELGLRNGWVTSTVGNVVTIPGGSYFFCLVFDLPHTVIGGAAVQVGAAVSKEVAVLQNIVVNLPVCVAMGLASVPLHYVRAEVKDGNLYIGATLGQPSAPPPDKRPFPSNCTEPCGCQCPDYSSDKNNCGACGRACAATEVCLNSQCTCEAGKVLCNNACVVLDMDKLNCGSCGHRCIGEQRCVRGHCRTVAGTETCGARVCSAQQTCCFDKVCCTNGVESCTIRGCERLHSP